jgi:hypothetical protein
MNNKIELLRCPLDGINCKEHRMVINQEFYASQDYLLNKDYPRSILALKNAFHKTSELEKASCLNCAALFRSTITKSLENIHEDLRFMSTGIFSTKRFNSSLALAGTVLNEMKNTE